MATQEGKLENSFDWEFEFFLIITFKGFRTYPKICMAVLNSDPDFLKDLMAVPWLGSARLLCLVTILSIESLLNRNSYPFWAAHVLSTRDSSACWKKMFLKEPHSIRVLLVRGNNALLGLRHQTWSHKGVIWMVDWTPWKRRSKYVRTWGRPPGCCCTKAPEGPWSLVGKVTSSLVGRTSLKASLQFRREVTPLVSGKKN